ncbi:MAG: outer membrane protein assembly factor BamD [Chitinophagaceae bacterium]|nr:outer membrane protein assembly factor BamD [Chitinophagaceae bacterium]MBL0304718.1 outer membrane protein assembly factor BamD [Chitinophagaceae bacterium]MBP6215381.1 outer membrane protein assembly factor BamD [Chitinophagaceae bacterium]HQV61344.1 outer membrane protein assembly factor BamD [Chitinophagaceae bacterium]HQV85460.1 outer membrane protein assembly factor BamD [Chitinophagaceae bacterium]
MNYSFSRVIKPIHSFLSILSGIIFSVIILSSCGKGMNKLLKNPDPAYKLRMAEQFFVKKQYTKAQQVYEDIMPYYKASKEFEDIYYKYAYCAYNLGDYMNAENLFKSYLEIFPNSTKAEEVDYMRAYSFYKQSPKPELDQTNTMRAMGMMQTFINTHPGSPRNKEATDIIDVCRAKLESKDYKSAQLYYDLGQFRAAGVAFSALLNSYPESMRGDEYKLMIIKSYYRFAELSIEEKKVERFEQVISECYEFTDRFPDSKLKKEAEIFLNLSQTNIKNLNNEQTKTPA